MTLLLWLLACGDKETDSGPPGDGGAADGGAADGGAADGGAADGGAADGGGATDGGGDGGGDGGTGDGGGGDGGVAWDIDEAFDALDLETWQFGTWTLGITQLDAEMASVDGGLLSLAHALEKDRWRGAELYSTRGFTAGRFEARIAAPAEPGTVCALFLYGLDGRGRVHEIDVELLAAVPDTVWLGTYAAWEEADGYEDGPTRQALVWQQDGFAVSDWHDYAFTWTRDEVIFEVDGVEVGRVEVVPAAEIAVRLNHWSSVTWPDVGGPPLVDSACRVDAVRARQAL